MSKTNLVLPLISLLIKTGFLPYERPFDSDYSNDVAQTKITYNSFFLFLFKYTDITGERI